MSAASAEAIVPEVDYSVSWHETEWHDAVQKERSLRQENAVLRGVMVRCYGCYANGLWFDSSFADFLLFFCLLFSRLHLSVTFMD